MQPLVIRPASGQQFVLRRGNLTAQVGQVAAVLRRFAADDVELTETWDDAKVPPMGCGIVLVPWPNRVADGRWTHDGAAQRLDLTEPSRGHAIHGLLRNTAYQALAQSDDAITLAADVYPQHGYPFALETRVRYSLTDNGLRVRHQLSNVGSEPAPFGVGAHPYLRVGDHDVDDLTLTIPASTRTVTDERMIPTATEPVDGTPADLRAGVRIGDLPGVLDAAFTDLEVQDGRVEHRLTAPDGAGVVLWADEVFRWAQVYTPPNFPGPDEPDQRRAVAVEPMTCGVNAFNTGRDVLTLEPGETWSASWGLRPVSA